ncbi:MAG: hypothetical protein ABIH38_02205 [Patescibacteria group bacterium]
MSGKKRASRKGGQPEKTAKMIDFFEIFVSALFGARGKDQVEALCAIIRAFGSRVEAIPEPFLKARAFIVAHIERFSFVIKPVWSGAEIQKAIGAFKPSDLPVILMGLASIASAVDIKIDSSAPGQEVPAGSKKKPAPAGAAKPKAKAKRKIRSLRRKGTIPRRQITKAIKEAVKKGEQKPADDEGFPKSKRMQTFAEAYRAYLPSLEGESLREALARSLNLYNQKEWEEKMAAALKKAGEKKIQVKLYDYGNFVNSAALRGMIKPRPRKSRSKL